MVFSPTRRAARIAAILFIFLFNIHYLHSQVLLNEICTANNSGQRNSDGDYADWIELFNAGNTIVDMTGYGLSDEISKPYKFRFPSIQLGPQQRLLVFASGRNQTNITQSWETAVNAYDNWRYFVGSSSLDTNWRNPGFNDSSWPLGPGGFGFGDNDDNTVIPLCKSVMIRKTFSVADTAAIGKMILAMDYDDGFVAYLNGTEIARANLGQAGDRPGYSVYAYSSHEALLQQGQEPELFTIDPALFKRILQPGSNVLAIQVHNYKSSSTDMSAIPFLIFGMNNTLGSYGVLPYWWRNGPQEYFQADFKLDKDGETLLLTDASGFIIDQENFPKLQVDHSYGRSADGAGNWGVFTNPTPLASNSTSTYYAGYAPEPQFSLVPGFYTGSKQVSISAAIPGVSIRYTSNGSEPKSSSALYTSPLTITQSRTIKAKSYLSGYVSSEVAVASYFLNQDIRMPVFTISTDSLNLWDWNTGIYATGPNASGTYPYKGANFWQDWEKPAQIEFYDRNKNRQLAFKADIEIFGNYSQAKPQKSFEIKLDDKYGVDEANYPFYPDKPQLRSTNNLVLRNSGTDWNKVHFRDAFMERVMRSTHSGYLATTPATLFLNGEYWGVYTIHENHDQHWVKNNYGLKKTEIDFLLEGGDVEVKHGKDDDFWELIDYATRNNANSSQYYSAISDRLDLENFTDYMIAQTYFNNGDWIGDWTNNIKMWKAASPGAKWKYLLYDLDFGLGFSGSVNDNRIAIARNPVDLNYTSDLFDAILNNSTYKTYFINRYADLINTIFLPSQMISVMNQFKDSMSHDMNAHFSKWPSFNGSNYSMSTWQSAINSMVSFINNRPDKVRDQIKSEFGLSSKVTLTFQASPAGSGRIQISTIVPDSYPWTGVYFKGNPVTITAIPNPGYTFSHWKSGTVINQNNYNQQTSINFTSSDQITAYFTGTAAAAPLIVSEFNYHSASGSDAGDWIELHNTGTFDLDLSGWSIRDGIDYHRYVFPVGTKINAGAYLVVAEDLSKFRSIHPNLWTVAGPLGFGLGNGGDFIRVYDHQDNLFLSIQYEDKSPWPTGSDGGGYTNELINYNNPLTNGNSWFNGCLNGSPGQAYYLPDTSLTINGSTVFCEGGQVELQTPANALHTYQWKKNSTDIPGAVMPNYEAEETGVYSVSISAQSCRVNSRPITVTVNANAPTPQVSHAENCGPGILVLAVQFLDTINWFDATGTLVQAGGNQFYTPFLNSTQSYTVIAGQACPSPVVPVQAIIHSVPVLDLGADTVLVSGNSLTLDAGTNFISYQWSTGASGQSIIVNTSGNYSVSAIDTNNCVVHDSIEITFLTGLEVVDQSIFEIHPIPSSGSSYISMHLQKAGNPQFQIIDINGKIAREKSTSLYAGQHHIFWNYQGLPPGLYMMRIVLEETSYLLKLPVY